jgi:uncharacterized protein (TIGR02996 family)
MTQDDAFLQAILEQPDDDAPRLVYADWLDEHGDAGRAEFIRVQIELARGAANARTRDRLAKRERRLLLEHESRWAAPLHGLVRRAHFVRGFPQRVTLPAEWFLKRAADLFRRVPVRHLILTEVGDHLSRLAESRHLGRAPTLEFRTLAGQDVSMLVRSTHLRRVTGLILRYAYPEDDGATALAGAPALSSLTALDLYGWGLSPAGVRALAASPHLANLTDLVLGCNEQVGDAGTEALAGPDTRLSRLTRLHLSFAGIGDSGAGALAASPALAGVRALDLAYNAISAAGARALIGSPHLRSLTHLGLRGNPITGRTRQTLAAQAAGRVRF